MEKLESRTTENPTVLESVPLEECAEEFEYISGKKAYRAPIGKVFRVEGRFVVDTDDSHYPMQPPSYSRQEYLADEEGIEKYEAAKKHKVEAIELAKGDLREEYMWNGRDDKDFAWWAFEEWYEENVRKEPVDDEAIWTQLQHDMRDDEMGNDFPDYFIGRWLIVNTDYDGNQFITIRANPDIHVTADNGWASFRKIMEISPQEPYMEGLIATFSDKILDKEFTGSWNQTEWRQEYVDIPLSADTALTQLILVDDTDDYAVTVPSIPDVSSHLLLPKVDGRISSSTYIERILHRKEYTEELRTKVARSRIALGYHAIFRDYVLSDFNFHPEDSELKDLGLQYKLIDIRDWVRRMIIVPESKAAAPIIRNIASFAMEQRMNSGPEQQF